MADVRSLAKARRSVCQVVTIAKFRRPANPRRCNIKRYHVWSWEAFVDDPDWQPPEGMACQCGCLTWTRRDKDIGKDADR